ncbi:hypothetical protein [Longimicrobium sp.]|uniref:hypothetical protein n=1 Tax=Longimicrobium sp. TaxID=2029185 RepID=UPI002E33D883|nr:hypothetical protein [Longimicrobium sp.]HEX6037931.1 hypothetical protein [Longimicrobium sp.]
MATTLPPLLPLPWLEERITAACAAVGMRPPGGAIAGRTVFVLLYAGAVAGTGRWIRPAQVVRMSDAQAVRQTPEERLAWAAASLAPGYHPPGRRWYAENTRESVRAVLRGTLLRAGAVAERTGLSPSSAAPRWALDPGFAKVLAAPAEDAAAALAAWASVRRRVAREESGTARLASLFRRAAAEAEAFVGSGAAHPAEAAVQRAAGAIHSALAALTDAPLSEKMGQPR